MKWLKRAGLAALLLPAVLIAAFVGYEALGMCVNHAAARRQTEQLQSRLRQELSDAVVKEAYSETGNTTGTGNHVDCLSTVIFSTSVPEEELKSKLSQYYDFSDEQYCCLQKTAEGEYLFYLNTSAPFADNLEGH